MTVDSATPATPTKPKRIRRAKPAGISSVKCPACGGQLYVVQRSHQRSIVRCRQCPHEHVLPI